jgi:hypothetical protein
VVDEFCRHLLDACDSVECGCISGCFSFTFRFFWITLRNFIV